MNLDEKSVLILKSQTLLITRHYLLTLTRRNCNLYFIVFFSYNFPRWISKQTRDQLNIKWRKELNVIKERRISSELFKRGWIVFCLLKMLELKLLLLASRDFFRTSYFFLSICFGSFRFISQSSHQRSDWKKLLHFFHASWALWWYTITFDGSLRPTMAENNSLTLLEYNKQDWKELIYSL